MGADKPLTTVVSTKGQVILPKSLRERRKWEAGTRLLVEETPQGVLLRPAPLFPPSTMDQVFGSLKPKDGRTRTIEEMDEGVLGEARRRARD